MSREGQRKCENDDDVPILGDTDQKAWILSARQVSYASITFTLGGGILGIVLSVITDRSVTLCVHQRDLCLSSQCLALGIRIGIFCRCLEVRTRSVAFLEFG